MSKLDLPEWRCDNITCRAEIRPSHNRFTTAMFRAAEVKFERDYCSMQCLIQHEAMSIPRTALLQLLGIDA